VSGEAYESSTDRKREIEQFFQTMGLAGGLVHAEALTPLSAEERAAVMGVRVVVSSSSNPFRD